MAKSVGIVEVITLIMMFMLVKMSEGQERDCTNVTANLLPCATFVQNGGQVSGECCTGLKILINSANTKADRQNLCFCIQGLAENASDGQIQRAASIPQLCGVGIPFPISRHMDCSKVNI